MCSRIPPENYRVLGSNNSTNKLENCQDLNSYVKDVSTLMKSPNTRCFNRDQLQSLFFVSQTIVTYEECHCTPDVVPASQLCAEIFRCLRNSCVECVENQNEIRRFTELYESVLMNFKALLEKLRLCEVKNASPLEPDLVALRCGLQFFGNFMVGNEENKKAVWESLYIKEDNIFGYLLNFNDEKVIDYTAMVLCNLLNVENVNSLLRNKNEFDKLTHLLVRSFLNLKSHWSLLCLEKLCEISSFWETYTQLPLNERLVVLDIIAELISGECPRTSETFILELSHWFDENVLDVVKCVSESQEYRPIEIMKALSVLCSASVLPRYQQLQDNVKLLESSVNVLKAVHILGKTNTNVFSPIQRISDREKITQDSESSPAYGFKKDLVRLIGNLCSKHRVCQDKVRELDGIPLLMDCCNIDINNPYIMQWCTFAIKNVMENNAENQAVLASITVTRQLVDSPLLRELGLCVQEDDHGEMSLRKV